MMRSSNDSALFRLFAVSDGRRRTDLWLKLSWLFWRFLDVGSSQFEKCGLWLNEKTEEVLEEPCRKGAEPLKKKTTPKKKASAASSFSAAKSFPEN